MSTASYPYTGRNGLCKFDKNQVLANVVSVSGFDNPMIALESGPVSLYVQAHGEFMSYGHGIFNGNCSQPDQAVTLVGYGS